MQSCPACGEEERLRGDRQGEAIAVVCDACGFSWTREATPRCGRCGGSEMFGAVAAIVEKGRGTQLSVVGSRVVHLCEACDATTIRHYLDIRPNPLMPDDLPNAPGEAG